MGAFINYVTRLGGEGVSKSVTAHVLGIGKVRYEGGDGVKNVPKSRYVIYERPL
jgi:hypothetical protein